MNKPHLVRIPVSSRLGVYSCHKKVYEVCGVEPRPLWRLCDGYILALANQPQGEHIGVQSRPFDPSPRVGMTTTFDLFADVSVSKQVTKDKSKRVDPVALGRSRDPSLPYKELAKTHGSTWLTGKADRCGFEVRALYQCDYQPVELMRQQKSIRIGAIRFSGELLVTNPDLFKQALLQGIGHSKAWGLGMLLCTSN